jgi:hypothetical protein
MKRATLMLAVLALLLGGIQAAKADTYTYVGSWDMADVNGGDYFGNPYYWQSNPLCYSGVEAAALLFGGSPSDYVTSTVDSNPADINFKTFVDGWDDDEYLYNPQPDTFKLQTGSGYNDPSGYGTAYSAYVADHGQFDYPYSFVNYAFRINATSVPEPCGVVALCGLGCMGIAGLVWRRRRS